MKTIHKFLVVALIATIAVACSDNKDEDSLQNAKNSLSVLSANTYLTAKADTGYVVLQSPASKASSNASWLAVEIKNDTVYLLPQVNNNLVSRSCQVRIQNEQGRTNIISVTQEGFIFSLDSSGELLSNNADTTAVYALHSNLPVEISSTESWITTNYSENQLTVKLAQNTTGIPRFGYVILTIGEKNDSIRVMQADKEDLLGSYNLQVLSLIPGSQPQQQVLPVSLEAAAGDSVTLVIQNTYRWTGVYKKGGELSFPMGQTVYTRQNASGVTSYFKAGAVTTDNDYAFNPAASLGIKLNDNGIFEFINNGSLANARPAWWAFLMFNSEEASQETLLGLGIAYVGISLRRAN